MFPPFHDAVEQASGPLKYNFEIDTLGPKPKSGSPQPENNPAAR